MHQVDPLSKERDGRSCAPHGRPSIRPSATRLARPTGDGLQARSASRPPADDPRTLASNPIERQSIGREKLDRRIAAYAKIAAHVGLFVGVDQNAQEPTRQANDLILAEGLVRHLVTVVAPGGREENKHRAPLAPCNFAPSGVTIDELDASTSDTSLRTRNRAGRAARSWLACIAAHENHRRHKAPSTAHRNAKHFICPKSLLVRRSSNPSFGASPGTAISIVLAASPSSARAEARTPLEEVVNVAPATATCYLSPSTARQLEPST